MKLTTIELQEELKKNQEQLNNLNSGSDLLDRTLIIKEKEEKIKNIQNHIAIAVCNLIDDYNDK